MNILLYKNFNNYYNRIVKRREDTADMDDYYLCSELNINFSPNDYMMTKQLVNHQLANQADYVILEDEDENIDSRWFVIESKRKRKNQWELTLRRDVLADNWDKIKTSPAYIYKGHVDYGNPLLWNSEGIALNQIKKAEYSLVGNEIKNQQPWIVGYVATNVEKKDYELEVEYTGYDYLGWGPFSNVVDTTDPVKTYNNIVSNGNISLSIKIRLDHLLWQENRVDYWKPWTNDYERVDDGGYWTPTFLSNSPGASLPNLIEFSSTLTNNIKATTANGITSLGNKVVEDVFTDNDERICFVNGNYYRVKVSNTSTTHFYDASNYVNDIKNSYDAQVQSYSVVGSYVVNYNKHSITVEALGSSYGATVKQKLVLPTTQSIPNTGAPYKIFTMPMDAFYDSNEGIYINKEDILPQALSVAKAFGNELYDLQIIPYCPLTNADIGIKLPLGVLSIECNDTAYIINIDKTVKSVIYWCKSTTTSGILEIPNTLKYRLSEASKVDNDTLLYRLVSPNYNGTFEFNPVKNNGLNYFKYDQTLKPYSPHIHVAPNFGGLYNKDFGDARGLICSGDFSLPRSTSEWANYELNNKNYQLQFQRQIDSMELRKNWGVAEGVVNSVLGSVVGGAIGGSKFGPAGTVAGASLGIVESGLNLGESLSIQNDSIQASKQQFEWNLQNIKARPYNLTNIGVLNEDYKYAPFLEIYSCSDTEAKALENKIKYEGMTINVIGTIQEYYNRDGGFLKASIIRLENVAEDYNLVNEINNELMKGVYIYGI